MDEPHNGRMALLTMLAVDREFAIVAALVSLIVAALTVSVGAWILLARERRLGRGETRSRT